MLLFENLSEGLPGGCREEIFKKSQKRVPERAPREGRPKGGARRIRHAPHPLGLCCGAQGLVGHPPGKALRLRTDRGKSEVINSSRLRKAQKT